MGAGQVGSSHITFRAIPLFIVAYPSRRQSVCIPYEQSIPR
ncbi:hypothetical protein EniLVp02_0075 [Vibrio phage EniLVp02]